MKKRKRGLTALSAVATVLATITAIVMTPSAIAHPKTQLKTVYVVDRAECVKARAKTNHTDTYPGGVVGCPVFSGLVSLCPFMPRTADSGIRCGLRAEFCIP
ncbi:hypothetical protein, partial [Haloechinothrix salitolerans]|uniref:hypothetical protein n=1 Tax=Haloechinothrix salitolerans TaxID=926830 RepID=UPI0031E7B069